MTGFRIPIAPGSNSVKYRLIALYTVLIGFNLAIWAVIWLVAQQYTIVLEIGFLAYSLGLRHALDADHIAAIDNVTRKLMQEGQRPVGVGFFFALGHSTIVIILSAFIALTASFIKEGDVLVKQIGGLVSTGVAAIFLFLVGTLNLLVLFELFKAFRRYTAHQNPTYNQESLDELLAQRGLLNRILRPFVKLVNRSWKMFPLGFLFGLGFDTASEVALIGLSATMAGDGVPPLVILLFPLLFAAGMTLIDATDGVLMLGAYGWAFIKPVRKLYYNLTLTLISVVIAFGMGTLEVLNILTKNFELEGSFWNWVRGIDFGTLGYYIVGLFVLSWLVSTVIYKFKKYDQIELAPAEISGERAG